MKLSLLFNDHNTPTDSADLSGIGHNLDDIDFDMPTPPDFNLAD